MAQNEGERLELVVLTPQREVARTFGARITAVTPEGKLSIHPGHAATLAVLAAAPLELENDDDSRVFAVSGGFLDVRDNRVVVLASAAETAGEIDVTRASHAKERAEGYLEDQETKFDHRRAETALHRAMARLAAHERHQALTDPQGD